MNSLSNMPLVKVMLLGVDTRKTAIFSMAFKMHTATQFQLVEEAQQADVLVVDTDGVDGEELWENAQANFPNIPRVYSSILEPKFDVAYLPKPVKVETLFPVLRAALSGVVTYKVADAAAQSQNRERLSFKQQAKNYKNTLVDEPEVSSAPRDVVFPADEIQFFDATKGLLGMTRQIAIQSENVALIVDNKPVLMYFPSVNRVLLAVAPEKLEELCQNADVQITVKKIGEHPEWQQHAKAQMDSCLWQFAVWTAKGRLIKEIDVNQPLALRSWPNITRLAYIPDAMRLSAFLTKSPVNLPMIYKMIRVDIADLLNFVAASHVTNLLKVQPAHSGMATAVAGGQLSDGQNVNITGSVADSIGGSGNIEAPTPPVRPKQSNSMLQRLLKKLTGK